MSQAIAKDSTLKSGVAFPRPANSTRKLKKPDSGPRSTLDLEVLPDRYVLVCRGDCMAPSVPANAPVLVEKHSKIVPGDLVVLFFKPELVPAGGHSAILKRLVLNIPPWVKKFPYAGHPESDIAAIVLVEALNPPQRFAFRCSELLGIHKCLGPVPSDARYDTRSKVWRIPSLDRAMMMMAHRNLLPNH